MNSLASFLKKDHKLPQFLPKEWFWYLILLVFPNILFWFAAWYTNTSRPIINMDYLFAILLLCLPIKFLRIVGATLFIFAALVDCLMLIVQIFPFVDIAAIQYFLPFITVAPKPYLIALVFVAIYILILPFAMLNLAQKQNRFYAFCISLVLILIGLVIKDDIKYAQFAGIMARDNYFVIHTQTQLYQDLHQEGFVVESSWTPKLKPILPDQQYASAKLLNPRSDKVLLIISESWGTPRTQQMQDDMYEQIIKRKAQLEFFESSYFDFEGATVQGEMRELCQLNLRGFALSRSPDSEFSGCLPNQFKNSGYHTIAMHGTSGKLYDRFSWYGKAGFKETIFGENLIGMHRCAAFSGVCDDELASKVIPEKFRQHQNDKLFFYWLTLTSHQPYEFDDIRGGKRFDCQRYGMKPKGDICHNAQLQTQFLDSIAQLIDKPEMKGTEIIIVGDHMPPILDGEQIHPYLRWNTVNWLHFKIK